MKFQFYFLRIIITVAVFILYIVASWTVLLPAMQAVNHLIGKTLLHCSNESIQCGLFVAALIYFVPIILFWFLTGWLMKKVGS